MSSYPVILQFERPDTMSRAHVFLRILILVLASWIVGTGGWLGLAYLGLPVAAAILVAQSGGERYLTENGKPVTDWVASLVGLLAYLMLLTDQLPGRKRQSITLEIVRSGSPTVGTALLRIVMAIPSALVLALIGLVSWIVWLLAAISILSNERYPERLWLFQSGVIRWEARLLGYLASLVEPYPPFAFDTVQARSNERGW